MNCKIPFTKDIVFEKKLYEITSISLEHEIKVEDNVLKGNFIVAGDFRSHEVSVNKEAFSYILPFEIDLMDDIDPETVEFMIEDFTYEVAQNSTLRVNIDFNVIASKLEKEEVEEEPIFRDASELFLNEEEVELIPEEKEEVQETEPEETKEEVEVEEDRKEEEMIVDAEDTRDINAELLVQEDKITTENENTIINSISGTDDAYATYHIHMVSDGESVETICTMYNSNINILAEYNDLNNLSSGDKLIIPDKNE